MQELVTIWKRTSPRALTQNQDTWELVSAWKTSHKLHIEVHQWYINSTRGTSVVPMVTLTWHTSMCKVHKLHQRYISGACDNSPGTQVYTRYINFTRGTSVVPVVTLTWHTSIYKVHKLHQRYISGACGNSHLVHKYICKVHKLH